MVLATSAHIAQSRTITTPDKIVYEVISEGDKTVKVAIENQSIHRDNASDIVIPQQVTDPDDNTTFTVTQIEPGAFQGTAVTSVSIEAAITYLGNSTFQDCTNLRTVTLPKTLTWISNNVFLNCTNLTAPNLHEGITAIGGQTFSNCRNLGRVVLPSTANVYANCFLGSHITELVLPQVNNGIVISPNCFQKVSGLEEVIIPSWWHNIGKSVFQGCSDLKKIDFSAVSAGNLQIEETCFANCSNLAEVVFPAKIDYIGQAAFAYTGLTSLHLPQVTGYLGNKAFSDTYSLKSLSVNDWPDTPIGTIGQRLFYSSGLETVELPAWMTTVPEYIFSSCHSLKSVTLSNATTEISKYAFEECKSLVNPTLPSTITTIGESAFLNCKSITEITLPACIDNIGSSAFQTCSLSHISIPASARSIGYRCFASNQLTSIDLPGADNPDYTPIIFNRDVFMANSMTSFRFPAWMTEIPEGFLMSNKLTSVEFAPGTTKVNKRALAKNTYLEVGTLPATIKYYGEDSFMQAGLSLSEGRYFASVVIGGGIEIDARAFAWAKLKGVEFSDCDYTLGENIFQAVTTVTSISFPDCMVAIPDGICNGWSNLTEIKWPANLRQIGDMAFSGCSKYIYGTDADGKNNILDLTKAPFNKLEYIGDGAFMRSSITSIIWPEDGSGLTIGKNLFSNTSTLQSAHIPGWMDAVPEGLYQNCANLTDLIWDESDRESLEIGNYALYGLGINAIEWPDVPTTLASEAFANNKNATVINWPESPAILSSGVFRGCISLTAPVEVPQYITSIPSSCFKDCRSLPQFTLHSGIESVGAGAFANCQGLKEFTMLGPVNTIMAECFKQCTALEVFNATQPVQGINREAFIDCRSLHTLNLAGNKDTYLTGIQEFAFMNCAALPYFPDVINAETKIHREAFHNATSLRHIILPSDGLKSITSTYKHFAEASSLQSVVLLPRENEHRLEIAADVFDNAPLMGVSYFTTDIKPENVIQYKGIDRQETKGILMVDHDQKYKFMEAGYGNLWDIREKKAPKLKLYGNIHSDFTPGETKNHYKAMIRWEIVESDLNEKAPTTYHLYRDGEEIASIEFGIPVIKDAVEEGNIKRDEPTKVFPIKITRDGVETDKSDQYGDFLYEISENLFVQVYSNQHKNLYFHPQTSHRIGLNESISTTSWFLYIDEFDSPELDTPNIPYQYTYTLTMDGYTYEEPQNNDYYQIGEDGKYWHTVTKELPPTEAEPCTVYTSMAIPLLGFDGIYTTEQIKADTDASLPVSNLINDHGDAELNYTLSRPAQIQHRLKDGSQTKYVIDHITAYEIPTPGNSSKECATVEIRGDQDKASGDIVIPSEMNPHKGSSYQVVTSTNGRGVFGSRIVTIPGAPDLTISVDPFEHCWTEQPHGHDHVLRAKVNIQPLDLISMGYNSMPDDNQHTIGIWRTLTYGTPGSYDDFLTQNQSNEVTPTGDLLYHAGEDHFNHSWTCNDCREQQKYTTDNGLWNYTDHFTTGNIPAGQWNKVQSDYKVRLYVQTPDNPQKWMIAEATSAQQDIVTSIENVEYSNAHQPIYYNLQGIRVMNPQPGDVVIKIESGKAVKMQIP